MSDKTHEQAAISRRAALKKLGLGTAAFVAPLVATVSEAEAKNRRTGSKKSKRSLRTKSTGSKSRTDDDHGEDYGEVRNE